MERQPWKKRPGQDYTTPLELAGRASNVSHMYNIYSYHVLRRDMDFSNKNMPSRFASLSDRLAISVCSMDSEAVLLIVMESGSILPSYDC